MKKMMTALALTSSLVAGSALAQNSSTSAPATDAQTSATSVNQAAPSLLNNFSSTLHLGLHGAPINQPGSSLMANEGPAASLPASGDRMDPAGRQPIFLENDINLAYKLNDKISVGPMAYFDVKPVQGGEFIMQEPLLKLSHGSLINKGGFNLAADIRTVFGTSDRAKAIDNLGYLRSTQVLDYAVPNSRVAFNLVLKEYLYIYGNDDVKAAAAGARNKLRVYAGPAAGYQFNSKLSAGVLYEMGTVTREGTGSFNWYEYGTDLEPYLSWDITPTLNFNPYLNLTTGYRIAADTTTLGALLTWKIL